MGRKGRARLVNSPCILQEYKDILITIEHWIHDRQILYKYELGMVPSNKELNSHWEEEVCRYINNYGPKNKEAAKP